MSNQKPTKQKKPGPLRRYYSKHRQGLLLTLLTLILLFLYFWPNMFITVQAGESAVLWRRFRGGTVMGKTYGEGLHIIFPWNKMAIYDMRVQELHEEFTLYSSSGLAIYVRFSARIFLRKEQLSHLHREIGPQYKEKVVMPEIYSSLRRVLGNYTPEQIYAQDEAGLLDEISSAFKEEISSHYMHFHDILILELRIPKAIQESIQTKLSHEQKMLSYEYILKREKKEKERRIIEAEGIAEFERLTGVPLLKLRGIEATEALAKSPNSKIILIGSDSNSLPVILNADTNQNLHKSGSVAGGDTPSQTPTDDKPQDPNPTPLEKGP